MYELLRVGSCMNGFIGCFEGGSLVLAAACENLLGIGTKRGGGGGRSRHMVAARWHLSIGFLGWCVGVGRGWEWGGREVVYSVVADVRAFGAVYTMKSEHLGGAIRPVIVIVVRAFEAFRLCSVRI